MGLKVRNSNPTKGKCFLSSERPHSRWDPPNLLLNGYRVSFPVVKRPGLEADQSFPSRLNGTMNPPVLILYYLGRVKRQFFLCYLTGVPS